VTGTPAFAAAQLAALFATVRRARHALPQSEACLVAPGAQEPSEQAIVGPARARRTPIARIRLAQVIPAVLLAATLGCATEPRPPVPDVTAAVHELAARTERIGAQIEARRTLAADAAWACPQACVTAPDALVFHGNRVECRCRKTPSLGVRRLAKVSSRAIAREPEELAGALSLNLVNGPGAAVEDAAVVGPARLADAGGSR
jgi:hypothetical protein